MPIVVPLSGTKWHYIMSIIMKIKIVAFIIFVLIVILMLLISQSPNFNKFQDKDVTKNPNNGIRYIAIGDSLTIGMDVNEEDRWSNVLTKHLRKEGIKIELVANPSVIGYTVRDAIDFELPVVEKIKPDFVTVFIGTNDNFIKRSKEDFRKDLAELLDKLQKLMANPKNIVLITIPDYSKSPGAQGYVDEDLERFIKSYNEVIKREGKIRNLRIADIFPVSQTMTGSGDYISDGLHPSGEGYEKWEKVILQVVLDLLK